MDGLAKWFNDKGGCGFASATGGRELFVRYTSIDSEGSESLEGRDRLLFDKENGTKGPQTIRVNMP